MIKTGRLPCILICLFILFGGSFYGCGKKGDPRPPGLSPANAISDLSAKIVEGGVVLRWSVPEAKNRIQSFKIQRSGLRLEGATCPDCPREYNIIADVSVNDPSIKREEGNFLTYLDAHTSPGFRYTYRVIPCDINGLCGGASNIQEVKISPDLGNEKEGHR